MTGSWRQTAAPIIAKVIRKHGTEDMEALRAALRDAYPFGERAYLPYKIWCDEVRAQLGLKKRVPKSVDGEPLPSLFDVPVTGGKGGE